MRASGIPIARASCRQEVAVASNFAHGPLDECFKRPPSAPRGKGGRFVFDWSHMTMTALMTKRNNADFQQPLGEPVMTPSRVAYHQGYLPQDNFISVPIVSPLHKRFRSYALC